ncbi:hypothetical protein CNMCM5793_008763 [Aspergillus hiratsukae]|uniref:Uncharacterized protein n=1 Tax=Aspergillus hiratsukae TaxID=1194566 RepID=A0A8H6PPZ8_9EURO|nr:hypothetical protein CNMCM5793_008763 [Aspergillus hiratsukae]KAF7157971.1 hypothetical protein CNMCM6106_004260 [Aspergillus hiratsukae]
MGLDLGNWLKSRFTLGGEAIVGIADFFHGLFYGQFFLWSMHSVVFKSRDDSVYAARDNSSDVLWEHHRM